MDELRAKLSSLEAEARAHTLTLTPPDRGVFARPVLHSKSETIKASRYVDIRTVSSNSVSIQS